MSSRGFFSAYDAAAGIGTGYARRNARGLSASAQQAIYEAEKDMPVAGLIFALTVVGSLGVGGSVSLRGDGAEARRGASLGPFILLILAGVFFLGGHPDPAGTLGLRMLFRGRWCGWSSYQEGPPLLADPCAREPNV